VDYEKNGNYSNDAIHDIVSSSGMPRQRVYKQTGQGRGQYRYRWVELPKQIFNTSVDENVFSGLTVGTAKGIAWTVMRTLGGMYEFVTFPFPIPEDYASVIEPEFVFSEE
jgi:putative exosortase-associated protein (TIGR04073 family)